jgi:hypothetical protein
MVLREMLRGPTVDPEKHGERRKVVKLHSISAEPLCGASYATHINVSSTLDIGPLPSVNSHASGRLITWEAFTYKYKPP